MDEGGGFVELTGGLDGDSVGGGGGGVGDGTTGETSGGGGGSGGDGGGGTTDRTASTQGGSGSGSGSGGADGRARRERGTGEKERGPGERKENVLTELIARVAELEMALKEKSERLAEAERRYEVDRALQAAGAVDLEIGRLMAEALIREMRLDDAEEAVEALRARKPFLFGGAGGHGHGFGAEVGPGVGAGIQSSLMSPGGGPRPGSTLETLAEEARLSGGRRELARYLQARRSGA